MTRGEIKEKKKELDAILKIEDVKVRFEKLKALAKEVGASITRIEKILVQHDIVGNQRYREEDQITESEIVHNIHFALQTETAIDMCKTASRNFWIAVGAMLIALFAMLATWVGVVVNWWYRL